MQWGVADEYPNGRTCAALLLCPHGRTPRLCNGCALADTSSRARSRLFLPPSERKCRDEAECAFMRDLARRKAAQQSPERVISRTNWQAVYAGNMSAQVAASLRAPLGASWQGVRPLLAGAWVGDVSPICGSLPARSTRDASTAPPAHHSHSKHPPPPSPSPPPSPPPTTPPVPKWKLRHSRAVSAGSTHRGPESTPIIQPMSVAAQHELLLELAASDSWLQRACEEHRQWPGRSI